MQAHGEGKERNSCRKSQETAKKGLWIGYPAREKEKKRRKLTALWCPTESRRGQESLKVSWQLMDERDLHDNKAERKGKPGRGSIKLEKKHERRGGGRRCSPVRYRMDTCKQKETVQDAIFASRQG